MRPAITTLIEEAVPGQGEVDLTPYIRELAALPRTVTMMMEHLKNEEEYLMGMRFIRDTVQEGDIAGVTGNWRM